MHLYFNGELEYKGSFKNGKKDGLWQYYSPSDADLNLEEDSGIYNIGKRIVIMLNLYSDIIIQS